MDLSDSRTSYLNIVCDERIPANWTYPYHLNAHPQASEAGNTNYSTRLENLEKDVVQLKDRVPALLAVQQMSLLRTPTEIANYHQEAIAYYEKLIQFHKDSLKVHIPTAQPPGLSPMNSSHPMLISEDDEDDYTTLAGHDETTLVGISQATQYERSQKRRKESHSWSESVSSLPDHFQVLPSTAQDPLPIVKPRRSSRGKLATKRAQGKNGFVYPDPFDRKKSREAYQGRTASTHCTTKMQKLVHGNSGTSAKNCNLRNKVVKKLCWKAYGFLLSIESELNKGKVPYSKLFSDQEATSLHLAQSFRKCHDEPMLSQKDA